MGGSAKAVRCGGRQKSNERFLSKKIKKGKAKKGGGNREGRGRQEG